MQVEFPLLELPPELVLEVLRRVRQPDEGDFEYHLRLSEPHSKTFINLSSTCRFLRKMAVLAGLFNNVYPREWQSKLFAQFQSFWVTGNGINSLTIDLAKREVWDLCACAMDLSPNLNAIIFAGYHRMKCPVFQLGRLGKSLNRFHGNSVGFRDTVVGSVFYRTLCQAMEGNVVRRVSFQSTEVLMAWGIWIKGPLFPHLSHAHYQSGPREVMRLLGTDVRKTKPKTRSLTRIEVGIGPFVEEIPEWTHRTRLCEARILQRRDSYTMSKLLIVFLLHRHYLDSLKVFVDLDDLSNPACRENMKFDGNPSFPNFRLLVFRSDDPSSLTSFEGPHDHALVYSEEIIRQKHTVWLYVRCPLFCKSDSCW
jgi:hypothetical protein